MKWRESCNLSAAEWLLLSVTVNWNLTLCHNLPRHNKRQWESGWEGSCKRVAHTAVKYNEIQRWLFWKFVKSSNLIENHHKYVRTAGTAQWWCVFLYVLILCIHKGTHISFVSQMQRQTVTFTARPGVTVDHFYCTGLLLNVCGCLCAYGCVFLAVKACADLQTTGQKFLNIWSFFCFIQLNKII